MGLLEQVYWLSNVFKILLLTFYPREPLLMPREAAFRSHRIDRNEHLIKLKESFFVIFELVLILNKSSYIFKHFVSSIIYKLKLI